MIESVVAGGACFLLDQMSKRWAWSYAAVSSTHRARPRIASAKVSKPSYNQSGARVRFFLMWAGALFSAVALIGITPNANDFTLTGLGLALGGAAGNLFEIVRYRAVTDFVDLGWWPAFNLADASIVSGVMMAILSLR